MTLQKFMSKINKIEWPKTRLIGKIIENYIDKNGVWIIKTKIYKSYLNNIKKEKQNG